MKTEPTISIQDEVAKIHAQYGTTEMANYRIEKLLEKYIEQSSPKIKQLEWVFYGTYYFCNTPLCSYSILQKNDFYDECVLSNSGHEIGVFKTLEEAESYAQADFERRVKECLD